MAELTKETYHTPEQNQKYMSVSLFKSFMPRFSGCEARAMAIVDGKFVEPDKDAFLLGGYVHAWNSGELPKYIDENYEALHKRDGSLYGKFEIADLMIETLTKDPLITKAREGQKEVIMTGELFEMPWKCMIDIYNPGLGVFTDLKTCREIGRTYWSNYFRERQNFILYYGYEIQMAVYAEIERQNRGQANHFNPHIIAISKEAPPDKAIITFGTDFIPEVLEDLYYHAARVRRVWTGETEPERCDKCDYCRATKKLTGTVFYTDVGFASGAR